MGSSVLDTLAANEAVARLGIYLSLFALMSLWEAAMPRRPRRVSRRRRWPTNLFLIAASAVILRGLAPALGALAALGTATLGWGALRLLPGPIWLDWLVALAVLDLSVYLQHVAFHRIGLLWRIHQVHHCDPELDASSGTRFHPVELVLASLWRVVIVVGLGASPAQVVVFEILLNGMAVFNHANLRLPKAVDSVVRALFVTPDMHRVHHSVEPDEHESNYGFNFSIWDRFFRTYRESPRAGQLEMKLGLKGVSAEHGMSLATSLRMPFDRAIRRRIPR